MADFKIYLIEDSPNEAGEIIEKLSKYENRRAAKKYQFEFEWIKGTVLENFDDEKKYFYDSEKIKEELNDKLDKSMKESCKMGILLDVLLTKEDLERTSMSYYAQPSISKEIYFAYCEKCPVYMITANGAFGTQSEAIMGVDLSKQFIDKDALITYDLEISINRLFQFYEKS